MPSYKDLMCSIEVGRYDTRLYEHAVEYSEREVKSFVVVPSKPTTFSLHLTSEAYIAEGICALVWIDGVYQGNKVNTGLHEPTSDSTGKQLNLRIRQKVVSNGEGGHFTGSQWIFDKLNIGNATDDSRLRGPVKTDVGRIDVMVLRVRPTKHYRPHWDSTKPPDPDRKKRETQLPSKPSQRTTNKLGNLDGDVDTDPVGGLFGLFDGAADGFDQGFQFPRNSSYDGHRSLSRHHRNYNSRRRYSSSTDTDTSIADYAEFKRWKRGRRKKQRSSVPQDQLVDALTEAMQRTGYHSQSQSQLVGQHPLHGASGQSGGDRRGQRLTWQGQHLAGSPVREGTAVQMTSAAQPVNQGRQNQAEQWNTNDPQTGWNQVGNTDWTSPTEVRGQGQHKTSQGWNTGNEIRTSRNKGGDGGWTNTNNRQSAGKNDWDQPDGNKNAEGWDDDCRQRQGGAGNNTWDNVDAVNDSGGADWGPSNAGQNQNNNDEWNTNAQGQTAKSDKNSLSKQDAGWDVGGDTQGWDTEPHAPNDQSGQAGWDENVASRDSKNDPNWLNENANADTDRKNATQTTVSKTNRPSRRSSKGPNKTTKTEVVVQASLWDFTPSHYELSSSAKKRKGSILPRLTVPEDALAVKEHHADTFVGAADVAEYTRSVKRFEYIDSKERPYAVFRFYYRSKSAMKKLLPGVDLSEKQDEDALRRRLGRMSKAELEKELLKMKGIEMTESHSDSETEDESSTDDGAEGPTTGTALVPNGEADAGWVAGDQTAWDDTTEWDKSKNVNWG